MQKRARLPHGKILVFVLKKSSSSSCTNLDVSSASGATLGTHAEKSSSTPRGTFWVLKLKLTPGGNLGTSHCRLEMHFIALTCTSVKLELI